MPTDPAPPLALVGPTASGKTEASILIAERLGAEIVSIDPALVYRGMDAWTGKPTAEQRARVRHHLIDLADPTGPSSVAEFQRLAYAAMADIAGRGRRSLLVGASGLYYRAVVDRLEFPGTDPATRRVLEAEASMLGSTALHTRLQEFDPEAAARIEPANARRTIRALEVAAITGRPFSDFHRAWADYPADTVRAAGVHVERGALTRRIEVRARTLWPELVEETERLLERGFDPFLTSAHIIGYAEATAHIRGDLPAEQAVARIVKRDRALARRQLAWFRRDPRIRWFEAGEDGAAAIAESLAGYLGESAHRTVEV
jgi:tRNA dimethylallyltransferase